MSGQLATLVALVLSASTIAFGQRQQQTRKPAPPPALKKTAPEMVCPTPLGVGVTSKIAFCDVMAGRDPAAGVLIKIPPHKGPATLTFDLHNRHTYSEEQTKANRAWTRYTATTGVLTMDNTLISRAVVQSEFRKAGDLVDRIGGGAGPGGVKAVAPTATEHVAIEIPEDEDEVSILGEKVTVERIDGSATYSSAGRPIAVISNVLIEYRPAPPRTVTRRKR